MEGWGDLGERGKIGVKNPNEARLWWGVKQKSFEIHSFSTFFQGWARERRK